MTHIDQIETRLKKLIRNHELIRACEVIAMHKARYGSNWARWWALGVEHAAK